MYSRASSGPRVRAQEGKQCTRMCHLDHLWLYYPSHFKQHDAIEKNVKILFLKLNWLEFILQLENFCNLIGFEQWYFSLIWNTKPFVGSSSIKIIAWFVRDIWHLWYFKIVSYFTHLTAGEISYSNRPFYSYGWKRGWRWPCFGTNLPALLCKSSYSYAN